MHSVSEFHLANAFWLLLHITSLPKRSPGVKTRYYTWREGEKKFQWYQLVAQTKSQRQRHQQKPQLMPAHSGSGPGWPTAPWAHPWGHRDHAMPMGHIQSRVPPCPHAADHPLGCPSSHQPLPTCFPSRGSQGKALTARLIWGIIKMRYLIQLKYRQQTKPSCTRALQGLIPLPLQWEPPGKLPPRHPVPAHTMLDVLGRAGEAWTNAATLKDTQLPAKTPPSLLQPWLSCIKIFQLSALKLQLNCSNLRLSQEQRAAAALQQTPLTT